MRADNTIHLTTAARRRHEITRSRTIRALRELDASGGAVTFEIVAKTAGVSRSWLYTQPRHSRGGRTPPQPSPSCTSATDARETTHHRPVTATTPPGRQRTQP